MSKAIWKRVKPWIAPLGLTLLCYLLLQTVILIGYVPSASMEPTLKEGSFILGIRIFDEPDVGDIIVFKKENFLYVKRVAAGPGDQVDFSALEYMESIPAPEWSDSIITVPDGCYFVLGDNTQNSVDSRYWDNPFIKESQILAIVPNK